MKILITGGKRATALKLLKAFSDSQILLGDYGDMPSITVNAYSFVELGTWNAEVLAHNLLTKCLDYEVDILLPLYEAEIEALSKSLVLFEEFGLKVLLPQEYRYAEKKFAHYAIFEKGKLLYASVGDGIKVDEHSILNGAYSYNLQTGELALISISNPL